MKKRVYLSILLASTLLLFFSNCNKNDNAGYPFKFQFITENYKPLNYVDNSILTGLAPDLLKEICNALNPHCRLGRQF